MSQEVPEVNIEAIRPLAMHTTEFWKIIETAAHKSGLCSLIEAVEKLSWKNLLAYDIRIRLILLEGLQKVRESNILTENDIKAYTPKLVHVLLKGRSSWELMLAHQISQVNLEQDPIDLDRFFTHVERAYITKFYLGGGILKTNPVAVTNGILNFKLLTISNPWDEI